MQSGMDRVPEGYAGLDICGAYIKGNEFILLGEPDEQSDHNCDAMGCGTFDHVLVRCEIPEWQAVQLRVQLTDGGLPATNNLSTPATIRN